MIQEKQIQAKVLEEGQNQGSIGMSLDLDSAHVLMQMLSKNLYSDPIGSTVRECASNALDSHRRAGVTEAIIVSLQVNAENNYEFSVEDFGTGLDADDVENIISKYGKSTKRETNNEIGMMGLGFKSPLAYSSSFYFVCRKNGVERKYMMYEGEENNTIDLLFEAPTEERNGVKIIVPVKYEDRNSFFSKIKSQLAYFENVFFDVQLGTMSIDNNFQIHRSEDFQLSELNQDNSLHICLDNVYYPIDYQKLGISPIMLSLGLRFSLSDGLFPTPNREQLIYTNKTKQTILDKINKVATQLATKYNENIVQCNSIFEVFSFYDSPARPVVLGTLTLDVAKIHKYSSIDLKSPEYGDFKHLDFASLYHIKDNILGEYKANIVFIRGQFRKNNGNYNTSLVYRNLLDSVKPFVYDETPKLLTKNYLRTILPNDYNSLKFVKKVRSFTLRKVNSSVYNFDYYSLLNLRRVPKEDWRATIVEFRKVVDELVGSMTNVDKIVVPQTYIDSLKKDKVIISRDKRVKLTGDINCKEAEELQRYVTGKSSKLVPKVLKAGDISSTKCLYVYGKAANEGLIDQLYDVSRNQKIKYLVLSEREHKVVDTLDIHNLISIDKFMEGKNKPFKRLVTSYLIHELMSKHSYVFRNVNMLQTISSSLHAVITQLEEYKDANYNINCSPTVYQTLVPIAEEHKLFDETIYTEYRQVKELLDTFPFINDTMEIMPVVNKVVNINGKNVYQPTLKDPKYLNILSELFKYNKIRIDYTNYKLVLNEDVPLEEELTEEKIEDLTSNN